MSVKQANQVDAIGVETATGKVILTLSDHLDWQDVQKHLVILEEKLNAYVAFVESGELIRVYPNARDRVPVIDVVARVDFPPAAAQFFEQVRAVLTPVGIELRARVPA